jgi:hypothetical protein
MRTSLFACALAGTMAFAPLPVFAGKVPVSNGIEVVNLPGVTVTPYDNPNAQPHFYATWQNDQLETNSYEEGLNHQAQQDEADVVRKRYQTALIANVQAEQVHALEQKNSIYLIAIPIEGTLGVANQVCISLTNKCCPEWLDGK